MSIFRRVRRVRGEGGRGEAGEGKRGKGGKREKRREKERKGKEKEGKEEEDKGTPVRTPVWREATNLILFLGFPFGSNDEPKEPLSITNEPNGVTCTYIPCSPARSNKPLQ